MSTVANTQTSPNLPPAQLSEEALKAFTNRISDSVKHGDAAAARAGLVDAADKFQSAGVNIKDLSKTLDAGLKANGIDIEDQKVSDSEKQILKGLFNDARDMAAKASSTSGP